MPRPLRPSLTLIVLVIALATGVTAACGSASTPAAAPAAAVTAVASPASATPAATGEPVASTAATPTNQLPLIEFDRADGSTVTLPTEVPPRHEYGIGLSGRTTLADRGMLFYYPNAEGNAGFWMKNTHIDLSIAFVDTTGHVIEIDQMQAESLDIHKPSRPYEYAIEAPSGWYTQHQVVAGDLVRLEFALPSNILN